MKSTGIIRKVDDLGRIVLPIELRRRLDISVHDTLEICYDEENVILRKHRATCIFCDAPAEIPYRGKHVCRSCVSALHAPAEG